jgi:hypothetical protein
MYKVTATAEFDRHVRKTLSKSELLRLELLKNRLAENPYIGKPLGLPFFREVKIGSKRVYYAVYHDSVMLLKSGHKNDQKHDITELRKELEF